MSAAPSEMAALARAVGTLAARGMRLRTIVYRVHRAFEAAEKPRHERATPKQQLAGERYGLLVVRAYVGKSEWECVCDCGRVIRAKTAPLTAFEKKCCGQCNGRGGLERVRAACFDAAKLYVVDGLTAATIGLRYDACTSSVLRALREVGIAARPRGRAREAA